MASPVNSKMSQRSLNVSTTNEDNKISRKYEKKKATETVKSPSPCVQMSPTALKKPSPPKLPTYHSPILQPQPTQLDQIVVPIRVPESPDKKSVDDASPSIPKPEIVIIDSTIKAVKFRKSPSMNVLLEHIQEQNAHKGIFEPESASDKGQEEEADFYAPIKEVPEEQDEGRRVKIKVIKKRPNYQNTILESFYTETMDYTDLNQKDIDAINTNSPLERALLKQKSDPKNGLSDGGPISIEVIPTKRGSNLSKQIKKDLAVVQASDEGNFSESEGAALSNQGELISNEALSEYPERQFSMLQQ